MADELIDIYDDSNNIINIQKMKSEAHRDGLWHRAAHIWIYNPEGEILLQLRSKDLPVYPNMWDISVAGHVGVGEEPILAAMREIKEEIGLDIRPDYLHFFNVIKVNETYKAIKNNEFWYVYFLEFDEDITKLKLQDEEVQEIQFFSLKKIEEELETNPEKYAQHGNYWHVVINEVKNRLKHD